jgi:hypothetical protein
MHAATQCLVSPDLPLALFGLAVFGLGLDAKNDDILFCFIALALLLRGVLFPMVN